MRHQYYRLVNKRPVPCDNLETAFADDRIVKQTQIGPVKVSTVFLGIDHNYYDDGPPILFETMVFDDNEDDYQKRHVTWEEAVAHHDSVCAKYHEMTQSAALLTDDVLTKK